MRKVFAYREKSHCGIIATNELNYERHGAKRPSRELLREARHEAALSVKEYERHGTKRPSRLLVRVRPCAVQYNLVYDQIKSSFCTRLENQFPERGTT